VTATSLTRPREHGQCHTEEEIEVGLTEVALSAGSTTLASQRLAERGINISRSTLEQWKNRRHVDRHAWIRDEQAAAIQRRVAAQHEDLAQRSVAVAIKALERLEDELPNIPPRDLPGALRNIATTAGISSDKLMLLRERPLPVAPPERSLEQLVRSLEALGVVQRVQVATSTEIPDAEVVDDERAEPPSHGP
jgi:hypothetical protein